MKIKVFIISLIFLFSSLGPCIVSSAANNTYTFGYTLNVSNDGYVSHYNLTFSTNDSARVCAFFDHNSHAVKLLSDSYFTCTFRANSVDGESWASGDVNASEDYLIGFYNNSYRYCFGRQLENAYLDNYNEYFKFNDFFDFPFYIFDTVEGASKYILEGNSEDNIYDPFAPIFESDASLEFENFSFNYDSTRQAFYISRNIKNESLFDDIKIVVDTKYFNTCVTFPDGLNPISFTSNTYSFTRDYDGHGSDGSYSSKDSFNVYHINGLESIAEFLRTGAFAFQRLFATQPFTIGSDSFINQTSKIHFVFSLFATRDGQPVKGKQYSYTYDFLNGNGYYSQNTPSDDGYTSGEPVFIPSNGSGSGSVNGNITVSGDIHLVTDSSDQGNLTIEDDDYTRWTLINNIKSGYELLDNTDTGAKGDGLISMFNNLMAGIDPDIPLMFGFGISSVIVIAILRSFLRR